MYAPSDYAQINKLGSIAIVRRGSTKHYIGQMSREVNDIGRSKNLLCLLKINIFTLHEAAPTNRNKAINKMFLLSTDEMKKAKAKKKSFLN